jgi:hypothetical protein
MFLYALTHTAGVRDTGYTRQVRSLVLIAALALVALRAHAAEPRPLVLVLPWTANALEVESRSILSEFLVSELAKDHRYEVISLQEVNMMIGVERIKDAAGCDNVACLSDILGALGAPYFVKGTVHRLHGELYFTLVLFDVKHQRVAARASADYSDDDYFYPFVVHDMVQRLLSPSDSTHAISRTLFRP